VIWEFDLNGWHAGVLCGSQPDAGCQMTTIDSTIPYNLRAYSAGYLFILKARLLVRFRGRHKGGALKSISDCFTDIFGMLTDRGEIAANTTKALDRKSTRLNSIHTV